MGIKINSLLKTVTVVTALLLCGIAGAEENCSSKGCHDGYYKEKFVHSPVRGRNCGRCHDGTDHPYPLKKKKTEICSICHKMQLRKHSHPPVKDGDCTGCHNPHASSHEKLLKKANPDLCFDCHDAKSFKNATVHPPVADNCMACHNPHDSDHGKLLKEEGSKLCYTCHEPKGKKKTVHPPVADNCMGCHSPHATAAKSLLLQEGNRLCFTCHDEKSYTGKQSVHMPVKQSCTNCHLPHDSKYGKLLKSENVCIDCHGAMTDNKVVHAPVASKECMGCHKPHTSDARKLLKAAIPGLCFECHGKEEFTKKVIHHPVRSECYLCHAAHSSANEKLLVAKKEALCLKCHGDSMTQFKKFGHQHPPVKEGRCADCHGVHSSDNDKMLKDAAVFLCGNCHNIGDARKSKSIHAPVEQGMCGSCHGVHGGNSAKLLVKKYSDENYTMFNPSRYELCFDCHSPELAKVPGTTVVTAFRNGNQNLHFVHVNKDKGRSCRFCHDPHMSVQEKLVKTNFRGFGTWNIPITFSKTLNGGGCVAGCHKPYSYDRIKPVKNK